MTRRRAMTPPAAVGAELRERLVRAVADLPASGLATLLAQVSKLCPHCGACGAIRSSRKRLSYFRCPRCGARWKRLL